MYPIRCLIRSVAGLVTLTFMAICVLNVFFGKGINNGVLVLPMGTLFAFTQLRSTLPGAPSGFGTSRVREISSSSDQS